MGWLRNTVAAVAMLSVGVGPIVPALAQQPDAQALERLVEEQQGEGVDVLPEAELLEAEELDALVAPVALYPDALLAQVLVASTYPLQVVKADRLLAANAGVSDEELAERIAEQEWDPSVMVLLSGFPTVIQRMAADIDWTERLGNAMLEQDDDVLAAVQRMRTQALETGYLASNEAQVVEEADDTIAIRPADPEVVYVPNYDPALAYTTAPTAAPYIAPSNNPLANPWVAGAIAFGAALLVQQLFDDDDDDDRGGWDDYWTRSRPIDWRQRQFYPRPRGHRHYHGSYDYAWSRERDDYWNHDRRIWAYDAAADEDRARERREAVAWTRRSAHEGRDRARALRAAAREKPVPFAAPASLASGDKRRGAEARAEREPTAARLRETRPDRRDRKAPTATTAKRPAGDDPNAKADKPASDRKADRPRANPKRKAEQAKGEPSAGAARPKAAPRDPEASVEGKGEGAGPDKPKASPEKAAVREKPSAEAPKAKQPAPKRENSAAPKRTAEEKARPKPAAQEKAAPVVRKAPPKAAVQEKAAPKVVRKEPAAQTKAAPKVVRKEPAAQTRAAPRAVEKKARSKPAPARGTAARRPVEGQPKAAARKPAAQPAKATAAARRKPAAQPATERAPAKKRAQAERQPAKKKACRPGQKCPRK